MLIVNITVENPKNCNSPCKKLLGVRFHSKLTFDSHVNDFYRKKGLKLNALRRRNTKSTFHPTCRTKCCIRLSIHVGWCLMEIMLEMMEKKNISFYDFIQKLSSRTVLDSFAPAIQHTGHVWSQNRPNFEYFIIWIDYTKQDTNQCLSNLHNNS